MKFSLKAECPPRTVADTQFYGVKERCAAMQELGGRYRQLLLLVPIRVVLPQKGHLAIGNGDDAAIGDVE